MNPISKTFVSMPLVSLGWKECTSLHKERSHAHLYHPVYHSHPSHDNPNASPMPPSVLVLAALLGVEYFDVEVLTVADSADLLESAFVWFAEDGRLCHGKPADLTTTLVVALFEDSHPSRPHSRGGFTHAREEVQTLSDIDDHWHIPSLRNTIVHHSKDPGQAIAALLDPLIQNPHLLVINANQTHASRLTLTRYGLQDDVIHLPLKAADDHLPWHYHGQIDWLQQHWNLQDIAQGVVLPVEPLVHLIANAVSIKADKDRLHIGLRHEDVLATGWSAVLQNYSSRRETQLAIEFADDGWKMHIKGRALQAVPRRLSGGNIRRWQIVFQELFPFARLDIASHVVWRHDGFELMHYQCHHDKQRNTVSVAGTTVHIDASGSKVRVTKTEKGPPLPLTRLRHRRRLEIPSMDFHTIEKIAWPLLYLTDEVGEEVSLSLAETQLYQIAHHRYEFPTWLSALGMPITVMTESTMHSHALGDDLVLECNLTFAGIEAMASHWTNLGLWINSELTARHLNTIKIYWHHDATVTIVKAGDRNEVLVKTKVSLLAPHLTESQ